MDIFTLYTENLIPLLCIQVVVFLLLFFLNMETFKREFRNVDKRYLIFLAALVFMMLALYSNTTGYEGDWKFWPMSVAKDFSMGKTNLYFMDPSTVKGRVEGRDPYPWGPLTPFLLGIFYSILGISSGTVYLFYGTVLALSMISFFFLGYILFRDGKVSILLVSLFCMVFHESFLGGSLAEFDFVLHLFVSMSLLFSLMAYKTNKHAMYMLSVISILFAAEIRFELLVLFPVFLTGLFLYRVKDMKRVKEFWLKGIAPAMLLFFVFLPVILTHGFSHHFWSHNERVFGQFWGNSIFPSIPEGAGITMDGFLYFWTHNLFLFLTPLVLIGLFLSLKNKKYRKVAILLLLLFLLHNYVFFKWDNGYEEKYAFASAVPYVLFAGLGINGIVNFKEKPKFIKVGTILIGIYLVCVWGVLFSGFLYDKKTSDPLDTSDFEEDVKSIQNYITGEKPNILMISSGLSTSYKFEFLTLYSTLDFFKYISDNFLIGKYLGGENEFGINFQRGGFYFNSSLEEVQSRVSELSMNLTLECIMNNKTIQEIIKDTLLTNNTYAVYDKCGCCESEIAHKILTNVFNTEILYEGECLRLYHLSS